MVQGDGTLSQPQKYWFNVIKTEVIPKDATTTSSTPKSTINHCLNDRIDFQKVLQLTPVSPSIGTISWRAYDNDYIMTINIETCE